MTSVRHRLSTVRQLARFVGLSALLCLLFWSNPASSQDESEPEAGSGKMAAPDGDEDEPATDEPDGDSTGARGDAADTRQDEEASDTEVDEPEPKALPKEATDALETAIETAAPPPVVPDARIALPDYEFDWTMSYRVRSLDIAPIDLSGTEVTDIQWTEQRFRFDSHLKKPRLGALHLQFDAVDGVLFGDNGDFGGVPSSNSGVSVATKKPNLTKWEIGLLPGGDPLNPDHYGPVLVDSDLLELNYLYADVNIPIGLLRIGRQPLNYGATVSAHDGNRRNRWGVSQFSDAVDRILFATKLDEVYHAVARTPNHEPDLSQDNGVIWALFMDKYAMDDVRLDEDDLTQYGTSIQLRAEDADWFGLKWRDFRLAQTAVHLRNNEFETRLFAFPFYFKTNVENVGLILQYLHIRGETREISEGFAALSSKEPEVQNLVAHGAQAIVDVTFGPLTLTLEADYASGDADPRASTDITSFSFARDLNVGLLMFEHILAFESARSVAVGIENLLSQGSDLESFPLTEVQTDGRFTNAIALFPQAYFEALKIAQHLVWLRAGVLMAWPAADGVVDPILTSLAFDGNRVEDDATNFHGGSPGGYYGTELDGQIGWSIGDHFRWIVEGAILFPGSALKDENGDAVNAFMAENRFEFTF